MWSMSSVTTSGNFGKILTVIFSLGEANLAANIENCTYLSMATVSISVACWLIFFLQYLGEKLCYSKRFQCFMRRDSLYQSLHNTP